MKTNLLRFKKWGIISVMILLGIIKVTAQTDVTSTFLSNAGFDESCNFLTADAASNLATSNNDGSTVLTVTDWVQNYSGYSAGASFEYGYTGTLNSPGPIPATASDGTTTGSGHGVLGVCAAWGGNTSYSQNVKLPAGTYLIKYKVYNSGASVAGSSMVGWVPDDGTSALSTLSDISQDTWTSDEIAFSLDAETTGKIQVGIQSPGSGSSSNGRFFFDDLQIFYTAAILSDDATLSDLSSNAGALIPTFSADITSYLLEVPNGTSQVILTATENDANASASGDGNVSVEMGQSIDIIVTAENGSTMAYTIKFVPQGSTFIPLPDQEYRIFCAASYRYVNHVDNSSVFMKTVPNSDDNINNDDELYTLNDNELFRFASSTQTGFEGYYNITGPVDGYGTKYWYGRGDNAMMVKTRDLSDTNGDDDWTWKYETTIDGINYYLVSYNTSSNYLWLANSAKDPNDLKTSRFGNYIRNVNDPRWENCELIGFEPANTTSPQMLLKAQGLLDNTEEGSANGQYPTSARAALSDTISNIAAIFTDGVSTEEVKNAALDTLYKSIQIYLASQVSFAVDLDSVEIEDNGDGYPIPFTAQNIDLQIEVTAGYDIDISSISAAQSEETNTVHVSSNDIAGTTGWLYFTAGETKLDSVKMKTVSAQPRYYIKQKNSNLVIGNYSNGSYPALTDSAWLSSQKFFFREVKTDTFNIVQDGTYLTIGVEGTSGWNTDLNAPAEDALWKITDNGNGTVSFSNINRSDKIIASDGTTTDSRLYYDKSYEVDGKGEWILVDAKFKPGAEQSYYLIQKASGLALGEDVTDNRAKLQEPDFSAQHQQVQFIESNVEGEYFIKNAQSGYFYYFEGWKMGFIADTAATTEAFRFNIVEAATGDGFYLHSVSKTEGQYVGSDNTTINSGVFPDKPANDKTTWYIQSPSDVNFVSTVSLSEEIRIDVEKDLKQYPVYLTGVNITDTVFIALPTGFSCYPDTILASELENGASVKLMIDGSNTTIGDQGVMDIVMGDKTLASIPVVAVETYPRYFIKQVASGFVMGSSSSTGELIPVLTEIESDNDSLLFILKPVNPEIDDSLYYLVQDVEYRYFSWSYGNDWDTELGNLARGEWKVVLDELSNTYSFMNTVNNKYVATDGTTAGNRYYADKSLTDNTQAQFILMDAALSGDATLSGLTVDSGTLEPSFDPSITTYAVEVPTGTLEVIVTATQNDNAATVEGDGTIDVSSGTGTATVIVTAENGELMTYTVNITVKPDALDNNNINSIHVYPTITSRNFTVDFGGNPGIITIYDLSGKLFKQQIATSNKEIVTLSKTGIFLIKIESENGSKLFKIVRTN
ncbi:cadherin-like beta sandwich domain-containing protein [Saccharicrinis sp. FJH2]|uniref:cadherin-like beta sandwich domain-containing protein n=1 Tax=Saccharicrinis sp. FJH65 TaxID=3344659 RepID=UPI0035F27657